MWFGSDQLAGWCMRKKWFMWLCAFSFIIFALHVPLVHYATRLAFIFWNNVPNYRLITYLSIPFVVICICILVGAALRRLFPKVYRLATGGRGF